MTFEAIEFRDLCFGYFNEATLLESIHFHFPLGQSVCLHGASGSGRSTLMKLMAGLLLPTRGHYLINGQKVNEMSFQEFLPYRLKIGYAFDQNGLLHNRTLRENLILPLMYHKIYTADAQKQADALLALFDIQEFGDKLPSAVPVSRRKACLLARTFAHHPELVFLDDPTMGLDSARVETLLKLIKSEQAAGYLRHLFFISQDEHFTKSCPHSHLHIKARGLEMIHAEAA